MEDQARHVVLTDALKAAIGKADSGTRIYRAEGDRNDYIRWWETLVRHFPRGLVSPGGACPYAGVSRAAVHRAMQQGRLTVFAFHLIGERRGIFGSKFVREEPYQYLPVIELKAWKLELEERIGHLARSAETVEQLREMIRRELEGEKPDWDAWFMLDHPEGRVVKKARKPKK